MATKLLAAVHVQGKRLKAARASVRGAGGALADRCRRARGSWATEQGTQQRRRDPVELRTVTGRRPKFGCAKPIEARRWPKDAARCSQELGRQGAGHPGACLYVRMALSKAALIDQKLCI
jgi:hypothetical protein